MKELLKSSLGIFRIIGFLEGMSFILLMFIAMPLKYLLNQPLAVEIIGMLHGVLFVVFVFFALYLTYIKRWNILKITAPLLLSSILPFGTFVADKKILSKMA
jgi:integral membrane protein